MLTSKICNPAIIAKSYSNAVYETLCLGHVSGKEDLRRRHAAVCKLLASTVLRMVAATKDTEYRRVTIYLPRCDIKHEMYEKALRLILGDLFSISMGKTREYKEKPGDKFLNRDIKKIVGVRWKPEREIGEGLNTLIKTYHDCNDRELREIFMAFFIHKLRK